MAALLNKYVWYILVIVLLIVFGIFIGFRLKKDPSCTSEVIQNPYMNKVIETANNSAKEMSDISTKAVEEVIQIGKKAETKKAEVIKRSEEKKKELVKSTEVDPHILGREAASILGLEYIENDK